MVSLPLSLCPHLARTTDFKHAFARHTQRQAAMEPLPQLQGVAAAPPPAQDDSPPLIQLPPASALDYLLPDVRIAKRPAEPRDASLLLVSDASTDQENDDLWTYDATFRDLPSFLPAKSLLVLNQSRVITARLLMQKKGTGGKAEVLCISPIKPSWDPAVALAASSGQSVWRCMIGGKNIKAGSRLVLETGEGLTLTADVESREGKDGLVRFSWTSASQPILQNLSFGTVLERVGKIPLPPYMNRASDAADVQDYQTVYAMAQGSVAAPTAGLHFTKLLLEQLRTGPKAIDPCYLTLHVGAGTFQPVSGDDVSRHAMHWERVSVPLTTLDTLIEASGSGRPILPVGTTSVRTLESLYWWGAQLLSSSSSSFSSRTKQRSVSDLSLGQWDAYQHVGASTCQHDSTFVPAATALEALRKQAREEGVENVGGETQLMVAPGYRFALCDGLITNFHQPRSTLLLLVGALMGGLGPVHRIYRHALSKSGYRFLSFGDSNLTIPPARTLLPVRPGRGVDGEGRAVDWPRMGGSGGGEREGWTCLRD